MMNTIPKTPHTTKWIAIKDLAVVWAQSQRELKEKEAARINAEFDPDLFGVITVCLPNGKGIHHVVDGQTRVAAVRLWGDEKQQVPCNLIHVQDPARAADVFIRMNTGRVGVAIIERFKCSVVAGWELETAVNKIITGLGYRIGADMRDGSLRAVGACCSVYKRHGPTILTDALMVIQATFGRSSDSVDGAIIQGYSAFLAKYGDEADKHRLVKRVQKRLIPGSLLARAKTAREAFGGNTADNVSFVILAAYNHGLRHGLLGETT